MPIARDFIEPQQDSKNSHGTPVNRSWDGQWRDADEQVRRLPGQNASFDASPTAIAAHQARYNGRISPTETRQELIHRVKKDQRATWLQAGVAAATPPAEHAADAAFHGSDYLPTRGFQLSTTTEPGLRQHDGHDLKQVEAAMSIERPRSALHRGDFREQANQTRQVSPRPDKSRTASGPADAWLSTSPTTPWFTPRHGPVHAPALQEQRPFAPFEARPGPGPLHQRARAASYTARSPSFVFRAPTSPLVNETQNSDSERDDLAGRSRHRSPNKSSRRRTFSPGYLQNFRQHSLGSEHAFGRTASFRRESTFPYQAHQPCRSVSSFNEQLSLPQTPSARSRRPSLASETSPLQRAPMVGRYEESILRGRMSSLPSRPLDFVAQIGVLGKGNCKPSLRCPPHAMIPFPAVYYNYGSRPGSPTSPVSDGPSPYVGMIDLESNARPNESHKTRKTEANGSQHSEPMRLCDGLESQGKRIRRGKHRKESETTIPQGGFRIPEQGQLQIIIKNPNKTAVKLFLVPYDLQGMQAGQKTFIRQRSYSAGPIIDMPLSARKNLGTDRPEAALTNSEDPKDRPVLRYLIHVNICCPSRGRYYLYKSIRVVFANRVPDGKEKLRQEIQLPEPRFSTYKPEKDQRTSSVSEEKARNPLLQRFSYDGDGSKTNANNRDGFAQHMEESVGLDARNFTFPMHTIPANISRPPSRQTADADGDISMTDPESPLSPRSTSSSTRPILIESPSFRPSSRHAFERLSRDQYGKAGQRDRTQSPQPGQGLLSLRLGQVTGSRHEPAPDTRHDRNV